MNDATGRGIAGITTRNDRMVERKEAKRGKMTDGEKFVKWVEDNKGAIGTLQLPSDIGSIPSCGCLKPLEGKAAKFGLRLTRVKVDDAWKHFECSKTEKGHA